MPPRVYFATTWNEKCGIADYSRNLVTSLRKLGVDVRIIANITDRREWEDEDFVVRCWKVGQLDPLVEAASKLKVHDILHLQHEWGMMGNVKEMEDFINKFHALKVHPKLVITVHYVGPDNTWAKLKHKIDALVVHSKHMVIPASDLGEKTYVIPHGCPVYPPISREEARKMTGLSGKIVASFGFMFPHKGWERVIEALAPLKDVKFMLVSSFFGKGETTNEYERRLKELANEKGVELIHIYDKFKLSEFMPYLASADIFITSWEVYDRGITSGSAMMGLTARVPIVTNDTNIYSLLHPYALVVHRHDTEALTKAIKLLLEDKHVYMKYKKLAEEGYAKLNWDTVARSYVKLYSKLFWDCFRNPEPLPEDYVPPPHPDGIYDDPLQKERLDWLKKNIEGRILEVGCATGYVLQYVGGHVGVDINPERLEVARQRGLEVYLMDATDLKFPDNSFDTVLLPEVLEHLEPEQAVKSLREALRVGRKVLITLPKEWPDIEHRWEPTKESVDMLIWEALLDLPQKEKIEIKMEETEKFFLVQLLSKDAC